MFQYGTARRPLEPGSNWAAAVSRICSVAIAALFERVLQRDLSDLDVDKIYGDWPAWEEVERKVRTAYSGSKLEEGAVKEIQAKYIEADQLRERLELLREVWLELCGQVETQLMSAGEL